MKKDRKRTRYSQGTGTLTNIGIRGRRTNLIITKLVPKDIDNLENIDAFFDSEDEALDLSTTLSPIQSDISSKRSTPIRLSSSGSPISEPTPSPATRRSSMRSRKSTPLVIRTITPASDLHHAPIDIGQNEVEEIEVEPADPIPLVFDELEPEPEEIDSHPIEIPTVDESEPEEEQEPPKKASKKRQLEREAEDSSKEEEIEQPEEEDKPKTSQKSKKAKESKKKAASKRWSIISVDSELEAEEEDKENQAEMVNRNHEDGAVRRSKRKKIPPLEFWRNEKVVYGRKKGPIASVVDIVRVPHTTPLHPLPRKARKLADIDEEELPAVALFDKRTKQEMSHIIAKYAATMEKEAKSNEETGVKISEAFKEQSFSSGLVSLPPKSTQDVLESQVLYVKTGKIKVTMDEKDFQLDAGSILYVPDGKECHIINSTKSMSRLIFFKPQTV